MGVRENYDDDAERVRTHPLLLPKPQKAGVVPPKDLEVLAKAMCVPDKVSKLSDGSTPPVTPAMVGRRSVLGEMKYGPRNRPYWEMTAPTSYGPYLWNSTLAGIGSCLSHIG